MNTDEQPPAPAPESGSGPFGSPPGEPGRVARMLDLAARGGPLPSLDRLAALAARLLGADGSHVLVVAGTPVPLGSSGEEPSEVDAEVGASLCARTVEGAEPVVVPDVLRDDRVDAPPGTTLGSYLGVPLVVDGRAVGSMCVSTREPRTWAAEEVSLLEELAAPVLTELELAALEASHEDDRLMWELAVDAAGVGAFDWELTTGELRWDDRLLDLFGLDRDDFDETIEEFVAVVHPEDRERVQQALSAAIEEVGTYSAEYRIVRPDGALRWIAARGHALAGPDGTAVRLLGAAYDTTAVQEGEARVSRALEAMPTAFFHLDRSWRFTYANPEAQRLLGAVRTDLVGHEIWDLFPASVGSEFERHYREAVDTGEPVSFEAHYPPPLDDWYEVRAWPTPDGLSVYFVEVTARHRAQEAVERAARRSALLADVTRALTDTLDGDEAVARFAQLIVPELADWCVVTLLDGSDPAPAASRDPGWRRRLRDIGWWHADPAARPLVQRYAQVRIPALADSSYVARVLDGGERVLVPKGATDAVTRVLRPGTEAVELCRQLAPESALALPLPGRGRVVGVLSAFRGPDRPCFTSEDLATLTDAAGRAGLALDNARMFAFQRDLAEGLQRSLMTAPPEPDHLEVAVRYEPAAEAARVGGDWYDAFLQPEGATVVVIGDVVGHDTEAAAAMGQVRGLLRGIAVTTGDGPAAVMRRVDHAMATLQVDTLASAVVARVEQTQQEREEGLSRVRWSNAGHPPPLVVHPPEGPGGRHRVEVLWSDPQPMLGMSARTARDESVVLLSREATLLLYTDGLVERRREILDVGIERLSRALLELVEAGHPLDDLCDALLARMLPDRPVDDVAVVALRLHPEDRPRPPEAGPQRVPEVVAER